MKLENCYESETQEFKTSLSELDKGILSLAAMLNKSGKGRIYFGVANDGTVLGLEGMLGQETDFLDFGGHIATLACVAPFAMTAFHVEALVVIGRSAPEVRSI